MVKTNIVYNYSKLYGLIKEKFDTQKNFADKIPMNVSTLNNKLKSKKSFYQNEMNRICDLLDVSYNMIPELFFEHKVQEIEQNCDPIQK